MDDNVAQIVKEFEIWVAPNSYVDHKWKSEKLPSLVLSSGKTQEDVENELDLLNKKFSGVAENKTILSNEVLYRGFTILNEKIQNSDEKIQEIIKIPSAHRPIWFVYSGVGCYWQGMGQQLILIPAFKKMFGECAKAVEEFNLDLYDLIQNPPKEADIVTKSVLVTAMQLTLSELLIKLNIHPDHFVGMSLSEICCGFVDGKISKEQAMKLAYYRGFSMAKNFEKIKGAGAMVFAPAEKIQERLLPGVYLSMLGGPICNGISGDEENVKKVVEQFEKEKIFAKISDNRAFHSPKMNALRDELLGYNKTIITENIPRSKKWVTSVDTDDITCSANFFTDGPCNAVKIYEAMTKIPENAIIVEVGPWAQIESMIKQFFPGGGYVYVGLVKRRKPELIAFLESIGKLYTHGCDIDMSVLQ